MFAQPKQLTSAANPLVKKFVKLVKNRKQRESEGVFVAEGARLCSEVLAAGVSPLWLVYTRDAETKNSELVSRLAEVSDQAVLVSDEIAEKIAGAQNTQGIFCVCALPQNGVPDFSDDRPVLFLEGVSDPGNMGSLIRTAAAFGFGEVVATRDSADFYGPKVLRAGMGGHFKLVCAYSDDLCADLARARSCGALTVAAALSPGAVAISSLPVRRKIYVLLGNEGFGLSPAAIAACETAAIIPMAPGNESLGVAAAGAIFMQSVTKDFTEY